MPTSVRPTAALSSKRSEIEVLHTLTKVDEERERFAPTAASPARRPIAGQPARWVSSWIDLSPGLVHQHGAFIGPKLLTRSPVRYK
jgi:hypothetical protein